MCGRKSDLVPEAGKKQLSMNRGALLRFRFKGVAHPIFSGASWGFGGLSLPPHELLSYHASWEDIEGRKYSALVPRLRTCLGFCLYCHEVVAEWEDIEG